MSLKQEGISYLVGCELPAVIVNVQRGGPGLGNIAPAQADYFQAVKGGGHGDYNTIVLAPASVEEMLEFTYQAFDLADKYRNPVIVLADGILGQMMEPVSIRGQGPGARGQEYDKPWAITGCKARSPNVIKSLILAEGALEEHNKKLQGKFNQMRENETRYELFKERDSDLMIVAYGSVARTARAVVERLRAKGIRAGFLRPITLWPFPYKVLEELTKKPKKFLVVEMSAGQMVEDVRLAVNGKREVAFYGRMGGGVPGEDEILKKAEGLL